MASLLQMINRLIEQEYERRVRQASQIEEYGESHAELPDESGEQIMNVPRGAHVALGTTAATALEDVALPPPPPVPERPATHPPEGESEAEIVNVRPGAS